MKLVSKLLSSSGPIPPDTDTNRVIAADDTRVKVRPRRGERAAHEMHFGFKAVLERGVHVQYVRVSSTETLTRRSRWP